MADFRLRAAQESDAEAIRQLIHRVGINPGGLKWQRFVIAVDANDELLGCGQLKPHGISVMELASLAVQPQFQGQGIGRALLEHLMEEGPRPLYLMCRPALGPLYEKFGFERLGVGEMPTYFRRIRQMFMAYELMTRNEEVLLVMKLK